MAKRTPPLYATGTWQLTSPFTAQAGSVYTCHAIRSIADLRAVGIDPFVRYYEPLGITRVVYEADLDNLPNIITLMSDTAATIYVPDTYIQSYPALDTIAYRHVVLSVSLGPVPKTLTFGDLQSKMSELVTTNLGVVDPDVRVHEAEAIAEGVSSDQHQILENARLASITGNTTERARRMALEDTNQALIDKVLALEKIIRDNGLLD